MEIRHSGSLTANQGKMKDIWNLIGVALKDHLLERLRATAHKYRGSRDRKENSDFLLLLQKDPLGELFSEIYFQGSSEFTFM